MEGNGNSKDKQQRKELTHPWFHSSSFTLILPLNLTCRVYVTWAQKRAPSNTTSPFFLYSQMEFFHLQKTIILMLKPSHLPHSFFQVILSYSGKKTGGGVGKQLKNQRSKHSEDRELKKQDDVQRKIKGQMEKPMRDCFQISHIAVLQELFYLRNS